MGRTKTSAYPLALALIPDQSSVLEDLEVLRNCGRCDPQGLRHLIDTERSSLLQKLDNSYAEINT